MNRGLANEPLKGLILVFDLDDTITPYIPNIPINTGIHVLNPDMITILRRALIIKGSNPENVSGIFLYTNNSDKNYIDFIHGLVSKELGVSNVFDDILWASEGILNSRKKNIADIEDLCKRNNISTDNLPNRVYFFDDQIHSNLLETLSKGHYILIKSRVPSIKYDMQGYVPAFNSATNLTSVRSALRMTGGNRRTRTKKNKKRYSRKH